MKLDAEDEKVWNDNTSRPMTCKNLCQRIVKEGMAEWFKGFFALGRSQKEKKLEKGEGLKHRRAVWDTTVLILQRVSPFPESLFTFLILWAFRVSIPHD